LTLINGNPFDVEFETRVELYRMDPWLPLTLARAADGKPGKARSAVGDEHASLITVEPSSGKISSQKKLELYTRALNPTPYVHSLIAI